MEKFISLGLSEKSIQSLNRKGFEEPTEIQTLTIPLLLENKIDIIAQAQTGTGKTAAFGLPLIEKLDPDCKDVQAIILAPTRELVIQVCEEINSLKGENKLAIAPIYGGQSIDMQLKKLKRGLSIVVGTPGRILDHIRRRTLKLHNIKYFILDEADEMLNMGFIEDIETVLDETPSEKRVLLFSATMPDRIKKLAEKYMGQYRHLKTKTELTTNLTDQIYFEVAHKDKFEALCRIIDIEEVFYGLIFCRTKNDVDGLINRLLDRGYAADYIHGDISQAQREKTLGKFKKQQISILAATDVAARGIDVSNLSHVINYSIPQDPESYIHRIGRTGRAGNEGTAITFITPSEFRKLGFIKKATNANIRKETIPEVSDIINIKKKKISENLENIISKSDTEGYKTWAKQLIGENNPEDVLAAILKHTFGKSLNENNYKKISPLRSDRSSRDRGDKSSRDRGDKSSRDRGDRGDRSSRDRGDRGDRGGRKTLDIESQTRLFIAIGKKDLITKKKLVDFIVDKAGISQEYINNIEIYDRFSFINVPFNEAEIILKKFNRLKNGRKSLVEKAKK